MDAAAQIMMPVTQHDALTQAHIQAMRAMSDQMAMLSNLVTGMSADLKETRDATLRLEAQELKSTMLSIRAEALATTQRLREEHDADIAKLRADHDADIEKVDGKTEANTRTLSRIQGIFLPVGIVITAILAFLAQLVASSLTGPPHHP